MKKHLASSVLAAVLFTLFAVIGSSRAAPPVPPETWQEHWFKLLAKHFPKEPENEGKNQKYTRDMNWGEYIHFMSGAAGTDLNPLATNAFGWPPEWQEQFKKARADFPAIKYTAGASAPR
jgi:hypothetical protein